MRLWSDSWTDGERIPGRFSAGKTTADGATAISDHLSPLLAWSELPACLVRVDVFRWVLVDLLGIMHAPAEGHFGGLEVREAICPHMLAEATHSGTYTLNRRLL